MPGPVTESSFVTYLMLAFPRRPSEKLIGQGKLFISLKAVTDHSALVKDDLCIKLGSAPKVEVGWLVGTKAYDIYYFPQVKEPWGSFDILSLSILITN